ncbi:MAG: hypothetical protein BWY63_01560 [Chloroflexi bacterium ADurb.Bin360]|nr:MAG: hypothetical protein BWY63_01560 [Chloroflexi bacterium ADurb.Bin360]
MGGEEHLRRGIGSRKFQIEVPHGAFLARFVVAVIRRHLPIPFGAVSKRGPIPDGVGGVQHRCLLAVHGKALIASHGELVVARSGHRRPAEGGNLRDMAIAVGGGEQLRLQVPVLLKHPDTRPFAEGEIGFGAHPPVHVYIVGQLREAVRSRAGLHRRHAALESLVGGILQLVELRAGQGGPFEGGREERFAAVGGRQLLRAVCQGDAIGHGEAAHLALRPAHIGDIEGNHAPVI